METREVTVTIPANKELKKTNNGFELVKKKITSWYELKPKGYWIDDCSNIVKASKLSPEKVENTNIFAFLAQAKKALAMAQLSQIMQSLNGDWVVNWAKGEQKKFTIEAVKNRLVKYEFNYECYAFLVFKNKELRDYFMSIPEFVQLAKDYFEIND